MGVSIVAWGSAAITASRSPAITFSPYHPQVDDIVLFFPSSTGITITPTAPAGWINPLGGTTDVETTAHEICCVYFPVTDASNQTGSVTYTATNLFGATTTGNVVGCVLRGVDPAAIIDDSGTGFSNTTTATPHVLPGLTGANLTNDSMVISCVAKDGTGAYSAANQPVGWQYIVTNNTNQGKALLMRDNLAVAGTNIAATNITPSAGDEYASITLAFTAKASTVPRVVSAGNALINNYTANADQNRNFDIPAGVVADDVVVIPIYIEVGQAVTPAAGFAECTDSPISVTTDAHYLRVFWKRATGAEGPGTYNFTIAAGVGFASGQAFCIRGCINSGDPWNVTNSAAKNVNTTAVTPAVSDTTTLDNCLWFWAMSNFAGISLNVGLTPECTCRSDKGSGHAWSAATKEQPAQGASGSLVATYSGNTSSGAWLGALKPATGAAPDTTKFFAMM